jgi:hypothetical protein
MSLDRYAVGCLCCAFAVLRIAVLGAQSAPRDTADQPWALAGYQEQSPWLAQNPIIVDVGSQPEPTGDISIDFVVGMFALAGVLLAVAVVGCLIVAGVVIFIKRRRSAMDDSNEMTSHTRLKI